MSAIGDVSSGSYVLFEDTKDQQVDKNESLKGRATVLKPKGSTAGKIAKYIGLGLFGIPGLCLGVVVGIILSPGLITTRVTSYLNKRAIKKEIEGKQIEKLASTLDVGVTGENRMVKGQGDTIDSYDAGRCVDLAMGRHPGLDCKAYYEEVFKIRDDLRNLNKKREKGDISVGSTYKLYKRIQELFGQTPGSKVAQVYEVLKNDDDPAVNFLRYAAVKYGMADGREAVIKHAKGVFGDVAPDSEERYSIAQTADVNGKELSKFWSFARDTKIDKFLWLLTHPKDLLHSGTSHNSPKKYDSHYSNPTFVVQAGDIQGRPYRIIAGPTPVNDAAYKEGVLRVARNIRVNNMDTHNPNEHTLVADFNQVAVKSTNLKHVVMGFDAKFETVEMDGVLKSSQSVDALVDGYEKFLLNENSRTIDKHKQDNGVLIPEDALTEDQIKKACEISKKLFKDLGANAAFQEKGKKELMHAIIVGVDTMLEIGIIIKDFEENKNINNPKIDEDLKAVMISVACKQCYDRGPVYLATLMVFLKSLTDDSLLTHDEFYTIAGLFPSRAPLGEGRNTQLHRYVVYHELAHLLGGEYGMKVLAQHTREYSEYILNPPADPHIDAMAQRLEDDDLVLGSHERKEQDIAD